MSDAPAMTRITGCRSCGGTHLAPVLSLGETPLANALVAPDRLEEPEPRFPLELVFCLDCTLLQLTVSVRPDLMFSDYPYFSSVSESFTAAARALAARLVEARGLGPGSQVVEIASNDGYLLQGYQALGVPVLGIDPAQNVAKAAIAKGVPTRVAFFGRDLADALAAEGIAADVIHANNVLAHVPDLNGVVAGMKRLLKPDGVCVIEVPYARDFIEKCEFDTIYHEHLCYFSASALAALFARHGLVLADVEHTPFHGGTLRAVAAHEGALPSPAARDLLEEERRLGMTEEPYHSGFAARVERLAATLSKTLRDLKAGGARIAAYGASAKGATLLNHAGLGADVLDFIADRSPAKQGLHGPGTKLPIVPPERLLEAMPDYTLLLTWNFAEEIMAQQAAYRDAGGRFVVPVPEVRIV
ncbi:class I SAM-dependent methyltransferase [Salinarimonas ramus]|uniref:NDP-hexose 3-C-methyltransferase n=1 Tax=Salinarimonas ramus TaxID=690164 RepID=A0A917V2K7_9HYPH|nr:class I SAM-dependent methyltransferase [Salinarimonas ramus]GGK29268.1 NDP-hexose 3-C-methyltransferase [Salinarimonas ramus]